MDQPGSSQAFWSKIAHSRGIQLSLAVVLIAGTILAGIANEEGARSLGRLGGLGTALLVCAQAILAVSPFPSQLVAVPLAAFHGFSVGVLLLWSAWMLAALLQYALARRTAADVDLDAWLERAPRWLRRFPVGHPMFLILTRQLPIGPHIVNISAGALGVPLARHLWCAAIGIVPQAVVLSGIVAGVLG